MIIKNYKDEDIKEKLYSAVISDILDDLGYRKQTLDGGIVPIDGEMVLVGRAFTAIASEEYSVPDKPYKVQMEAIDSISKDEVFVVTTQGSKSSAFWGELLTTACMVRGGVGAVIDGLSRDTKKILKKNFPVFTRGHIPTDSKGRLEVIHYQEPIEINGVLIRPGDLIFGDIDGVVVIPKEVEDQVIKLAFEKFEGENLVRKEIEQGMSCTEVFEKYGIL